MLISPFFWLLAGLSGHSAANRRQIRETPEKPRSRAQLFGRFCAWGNVRPHVLRIHGSLARAFALPQGTEAKLFPCLRKQEPCVGLHSEPAACVRDWAQAQTRCATCSPQVGRTFSSYLSPFSVWLLPLNFLFICRSGRDGPLLSSEKKVDKDSQKGFAPSNPIPVPCGRSPLFPRCWPA